MDLRSDWVEEVSVKGTWNNSDKVGRFLQMG